MTTTIQPTKDQPMNNRRFDDHSGHRERALTFIRVLAYSILAMGFLIVVFV